MNKFEKALKFIREHIDETSEFYGKIYLVGGCVRDELLGTRFTDLDLLVNIPDGQKKFVEYMCATYPNICKGPFYYKRYGTTAMDMIMDRTLTLVECVEPHIEVYNEDGTELLETHFCTLEEDAKRRDYTCNALYKNIHSGEIYDPSGMSIADLNSKYLRTPGDPVEIYKQDPVRMLRGIRFKHQKGFRLDPKAWDAIVELHDMIENSAPNRMQEEMHKIIKCKNMPAAFYDLYKCGLLKYLFPNFVPYMDIDLHPNHVEEGMSLWKHTCTALEVLIKEHPQTDTVSKLIVLFADIAMIDGVDGVRNVLKGSLLGKEKINLVLVHLERYLHFHTLFENGVYINPRSSVLPRFINSIAAHKSDFRRLVRALNHGMKKEYQLPYQIFYDNAKLPRPKQKAEEVYFSPEERAAYRKEKQDKRRCQSRRPAQNNSNEASQKDKPKRRRGYYNRHKSRKNNIVSNE